MTNRDVDRDRSRLTPRSTRLLAVATDGNAEVRAREDAKSRIVSKTSRAPI